MSKSFYFFVSQFPQLLRLRIIKAFSGTGAKTSQPSESKEVFFIIIVTAHRWIYAESWTEVLILPSLPQAVSLGKCVTSCNLPCVLSRIVIWLWLSVCLVLFVAFVGSPNSLFYCQLLANRYHAAKQNPDTLGYTDANLYTNPGGCLASAWALPVDKGKETLMTQQGWRFHTVRWYRSLLSQYHELLKEI